MKKGIKIFLIVFTVLILLLGVGVFVGVFSAYKYYDNSINKKSDKDETVIITVKQGMNSSSVIDLLVESDLLENKYVGVIYTKLNKDLNLQAGTYELNRNMSLIEILDKINKGDVIDNSISVTFVEGKQLPYFAKVISQNFPYEEEVVMKKLEDEKYIKTLIDKYWFLTDEILNDKLYYALEGYLYPSTYYFNKDASIEEIIDKLLTQTGIELNKYDLEQTDWSIHEILTLASIIQNEGKVSDFANISSVFHNRLNLGMQLQSCATSYYGAKVDFSSQGIADSNLITHNNPFNTYIISGLPAGPISSPSTQAIEAAVNPNDTNYLYFLSDNEGVSYFFATYTEHQNKQSALISAGKWYR